VKPRAVAAGVALLACLAGCGYTLAGRGGAIDPSIKRLGVPQFKDRTAKPTLDQKVTDRVIEELLKHGRFDVVKESVGVDAVVEGEILRYDTVPIGFSEEGQAQPETRASRYAITITARVRYYKPDVKEPLWASESFSFRDEYDLGEDPATFFDREEQAIDRLATAFARSLVAAMLEAF
jgi:hypothetical protein